MNTRLDEAEENKGTGDLDTYAESRMSRCANVLYDLNDNLHTLGRCSHQTRPHGGSPSETETVSAPSLLPWPHARI
jgi:hypothetical protein